MEVLNSLFNKSKAASHFLNYSKSKTLKVCLQSVYPTVKLVLELRAVEHQESVFFSIKTWSTITSHKSEISRAMRGQNEQLIFVNNELKVFTECMHDQCAVCFLDSRGKRVNIMLKTFSKMMELGPQITGEYKKLMETINATAKDLSKFMDFILTQCTGTRRCNDLKGHLEMLSNYSEPGFENSDSNLSYTSDDTELEEEDSEDEYNDYDDYDRCSYCNRRRRYY